MGLSVEKLLSWRREHLLINESDSNNLTVWYVPAEGDASRPRAQPDWKCLSRVHLNLKILRVTTTTFAAVTHLEMRVRATDSWSKSL